jgi:20S proteasome subunit beta 7
MSTGFHVASGREDPISHTRRPIVTGTSVVAVKYDGGVLMAADTLGSYGSLSRFTDVRRLLTTGPYTLVGAGGDYSDLQAIDRFLNKLDVRESFNGDGLNHTPKELFNRLTRLLYFRRTKMDPLWNTLVIAGHDGKETFLGTTDMIGTSYECDFVATGFGMHLAMPILRKRWTEGMSKEDAQKLLEDCMKVCFYRDCRTINRITFGSATAGGPVVEEPVALETEWNYKTFINPSD